MTFEEHDISENEVFRIEVQETDPKSHLFDLERWHQSDDIDRVLIERHAIETHFTDRGQGHLDEIQRFSAQIPEMLAECKHTIVIPAYNEGESILGILEALNKQEGIDVDQWEILFILNKPLRETAEQSMDSSLGINIMEKVIGTYNSKIKCHTVRAFFPKNIASVGMARLLGHDIAMYRSSSRTSQQSPHYIVGIDADTPDLDTALLRTIESKTRASDINLLRLKGGYDKNVLINFPLLNVLNLLWEESFSQVALTTKNPWTIGRGLVIQTYAHACGGGVKGTEYGGAGEDIRIGTSISNLSNSIIIDEIDNERYGINPRREINILEQLVASIDKDAVFNRDLHEYARTLKAYLTFNDIREGNKTESTEGLATRTEWLVDPKAFTDRLNTEVIEILVNSWWYLIRTEYSLDALRRINVDVQALYRTYEDGSLSYPYLQQSFNALERNLYLNGNTDLIEKIVDSNIKAAIDLSEILNTYGIEMEVSNIDHEPPSMDSSAIFQKPLISLDIESFREYLIDKLLT